MVLENAQRNIIGSELNEAERQTSCRQVMKECGPQRDRVATLLR